MSYVILDPGGDYPSKMVEFLASTGRDAMAVFTDEGRYWAYKHMYEDRLGHAIRGEYILPQWPSWEAVAGNIYSTLGGEVEGIIPWDERTVEIGAYLGDLLGAGWNPHEVIHRFRNKYSMKAFLRTYGNMRINDSQLVEDLHDVWEFQNRLGRWPIVVKPTEGAGSHGVSFAYDEHELLAGCQGVLNSGEGQILLEEFVPGHELVVNGLVDAAGDLLPTDVWVYDRRPSHGYENLYYQTTKLPTTSPIFWQVAEYAGEIVDCLGLRRSPIHMELKLDAYGPCLIEVGARLSGGGLPHLASSLHGRCLFELAACHYLAHMRADPNDLDYERYDRIGVRHINGIQTYPIDRVSQVHGVDEIEGLPSFYGWGKLVPPGMHLPMTTDMYSSSYELYLMHEDQDQVDHDALVARQLLHYS